MFDFDCMSPDMNPDFYVSIANVIDEYVIPALGEHAANFDVEAIADEITEDYQILSEVTESGREVWSHQGFIIRDDVDFWEVVARHEI